MGLAIAVVSQKGGVGKSTLARLIAREYAAHDWRVQIADADLAQTTSLRWQTRRQAAGVEPAVAVEPLRMDEIERRMEQFDLIVMDGAPHSSANTLRMANAADLVILPTGLALDDLEPAVLLAHELVKESIPKQRIAFALCRVGDNETEISEARAYLERAGYRVLAGEIPERTAYRRASDAGRSLTETRFASLNERADALAQSIMNRLHRR
jgi:chromosome partitioning protein